MLKQRLAPGPSNLPTAGSLEISIRTRVRPRRMFGRVYNGFRWAFPNTEMVIVEMLYWMQELYLVRFKC